MSFIPKNSYIFYLIIVLTIFDYASSSLKFNIPNNREKCFAEELYNDGTLLIRYDLKGIEFVEKEHQEKVLKNIKLYVKDPHGKIVKELFLIDLKGKFAIKTEEVGIYYICTKYFKTWKVTQLPKEVLLGIKIRTDYTFKRIDESLKKEELSDLMEQIRQVTLKVIPSISSSKMEIDEEDKMAKAIISTSNLYFNLALLQLLLIFIIAIYQIFNLRKFLSSKRII